VCAIQPACRTTDRRCRNNPAFWAEFPEYDDIGGVNEFHTWKNARVKIYLRPRMSIHSFFLPNLRLKQDALRARPFRCGSRSSRAMLLRQGPGCVVLDKETDKLWEIACAELLRRPPLRHARQTVRA